MEETSRKMHNSQRLSRNARFYFEWKFSFEWKAKARKHVDYFKSSSLEAEPAHKFMESVLL